MIWVYNPTHATKEEKKSCTHVTAEEEGGGGQSKAEQKAVYNNKTKQ